MAGCQSEDYVSGIIREEDPSLEPSSTDYNLPVTLQLRASQLLISPLVYVLTCRCIYNYYNSWL